METPLEPESLLLPSELLSSMPGVLPPRSTSLVSTWPHKGGRELGLQAGMNIKIGPASLCKAVACNSGANTVGTKLKLSV